MAKLEYTQVGQIADIVSRTRAGFQSHKTRPLEWRLVQLRKLYWGIIDHEKELVEALKADLGKSSFESLISEVGWCKNDILFVCDNLKKWAADEVAGDIELAHRAVRPKIRKDPLGNVLVIGAYNFPFQLSLGPFVGAIAAGCTAVLKPSEVSPATAAVMQRVIESSLDPAAFAVVQGGVAETTALLDQKWDKIFYTGGASVGTIVAKKAAETLTPVTLELGGLNPAIVTSNADLKLAARRLLWGKHFNAGQVCTSHNYTLIERSVLDLFVEHLRSTVNEFYPSGVAQSPDYARIVNERHFERIKSLLDSTRGKILIGGATNKDDLFIEPTVVLVEDESDPLLQNESFGPLIPLLAVDSLDQAISTANNIHATPLGVFPFGSKPETDRILMQTRSGGAAVNDSYYHLPTFQFGGVGTSGSGSYRGRASFECFSHRRTVTKTPAWFESLISVRYPPYTASKQRMMGRMMNKKPGFDRSGNLTGGTKALNTLWTLVGLGGESSTGILGRYFLVAAVAVAVRQALERR